jgi:hypothetical protein
MSLVGRGHMATVGGSGQRGAACVGDLRESLWSLSADCDAMDLPSRFCVAAFPATAGRITVRTKFLRRTVGRAHPTLNRFYCHGSILI